MLPKMLHNRRCMPVATANASTPGGVAACAAARRRQDRTEGKPDENPSCANLGVAEAEFSPDPAHAVCRGRFFARSRPRIVAQVDFSPDSPAATCKGQYSARLAGGDLRGSVFRPIPCPAICARVDIPSDAIAGRPRRRPVAPPTGRRRGPAKKRARREGENARKTGYAPQDAS